MGDKRRGRGGGAEAARREREREEAEVERVGKKEIVAALPLPHVFFRVGSGLERKNENM